MAASTSIISRSKNWFGQAMDFFSSVESNELQDFGQFNLKLIYLELAIHRKAFDRNRFRLLPSQDQIRETYDEMMKKPQQERVAFLIHSLLFTSMINVEASQSLLIGREDSYQNHLDDCPRAIPQHFFSIRSYPEYYEIFVDKMLKEYELQTQKPLSELIVSVSKSNWVSSVIQTILTPKDVLLMHSAFQEVDPLHQEATRADQVEIGKQIDSTILCIAIKQLLKLVDVEKKEILSDDISKTYLKGFFKGRKIPLEEGTANLAVDLFSEYLNKIIYSAPPEKYTNVKKYLILSLKIRGRQLP